MRKVGGDAEIAIKECGVLCSLKVACSTASAIACGMAHPVTVSFSRGNAEVSFLQNR